MAISQGLSLSIGYPLSGRASSPTPPPPEDNWQSFELTAGDIGGGFTGYLTDPATGEISREPSPDSTLLEIQNYAAADSFQIVFSGDIVEDLQDRTLYIDDQEFPLEDVSISPFTGDTVAVYTPPFGLEVNEVYVVRFSKT